MIVAVYNALFSAYSFSVFSALAVVSVADWEKAIFQKHSRSVTDLPMQTYMNVIAKREYYGATLFAAKVRHALLLSVFS